MTFVFEELFSVFPLKEFDENRSRKSHDIINNAVYAKQLFNQSYKKFLGLPGNQDCYMYLLCSYVIDQRINIYVCSFVLLVRFNNSTGAKLFGCLTILAAIETIPLLRSKSSL